MRTEEQIKERIKWLANALDDADNQTEIQQIKLWNAIDTLKWVLGV